jgi:hypothetical protein
MATEAIAKEAMIEKRIFISRCLVEKVSWFEKEKGTRELYRVFIQKANFAPCFPFYFYR